MELEFRLRFQHFTVNILLTAAMSAVLLIFWQKNSLKSISAIWQTHGGMKGQEMNAALRLNQRMHFINALKILTNGFALIMPVRWQWLDMGTSFMLLPDTGFKTVKS
ncbi:hypothetical protein QU24_23320 [Pantoea rodasii]|uniref:Uncharacterized protein n=1 Tax=Pantoea rodasii TaxID=1076549 RepID=A0A0B1R1Z0_9GAMM|nr:hypothetical protein QU24_23320 [Pantoea rodasii]